jgi:hypothetical protein
VARWQHRVRRSRETTLSDVGVLSPVHTVQAARALAERPTLLYDHPALPIVRQSVATKRREADVKLINTDGMAFIGPGSEWFWTALSGIVLAVTFLAIYRQLRLQSSAGAIEQTTALARDWNSELLHRSRLAVLRALQDETHTADIDQAAPIEVGNYWERVGWLVRSGHIDRRIVYAYLGSTVRLWWALLMPNTQRLRHTQEDPAVYEHFEWLAGLMTELDRRAGSTMTYDDPAYVAQTIQSNIERSLSAISLAEELRSAPQRPRLSGRMRPSPASSVASSDIAGH